VKKASHKPATTICLYLFKVPRIVKFIETESRVVWPVMETRVMGNCYLMDAKFEPGKMKSCRDGMEGN
jgi:hypothetical protein